MGRLIGEKLKDLREREGLSQADMAYKLRLKTPQSISNIERGVAPLPRVLLPKVCKLLNANPRELVDLLVEETREKYIKALDRAGVKTKGLTVRTIRQSARA
jgi:transcriptional regulator with XRE-family HTH domain